MKQMLRLSLLLLGVVSTGACMRLGFGPRAGSEAGVDAAVADGPRDGASSTTDSRPVDGDGPPARDAAPDTGPLVPSAGTLASATSYGGAGNDEGYDVAVDRAGNVIVVGTFELTVQIGGTTLVSKGGDDAFVAAFAPGGAPRWAKGFGSATGDDRAQGVAVDSAGNIYVCGLFTGAADFGGKQQTATGSWDIFLVSYDPNGTLRWAKRAGAVGRDFAYDVAADPAGNVLLTGYYEGAASFDATSLPARGDLDIFVAKYAGSNGTLTWAKGFGSGGTESGYGVDADAAGNVVLGGSYAAPIDLGQGPIGSTSGSFVAKLTPTGSLTWAKPFENTTLWDLDVERASGRVLVASRVGAGADLGAGPLAPAGGQDALVQSLDASGAQQWYAILSGALSDIGLGVTVDGLGNSYAIGMGGIDMDLGTGTLVPGNGNQDVFVVSHDAAGKLRWAKLFGGPDQDRGYGIAVAPSGALWVTGRYDATAQLGPGQPSTSAGLHDIFLVGYR